MGSTGFCDKVFMLWFQRKREKRFHLVANEIICFLSCFKVDLNFGVVTHFFLSLEMLVFSLKMLVCVLEMLVSLVFE